MGVSDSAVAYIGDDLPDIPLMRRAGLTNGRICARTRYHDTSEKLTMHGMHDGLKPVMCSQLVVDVDEKKRRSLPLAIGARCTSEGWGRQDHTMVWDLH